MKIAVERVNEHYRISVKIAHDMHGTLAIDGLFGVFALMQGLFDDIGKNSDNLYEYYLIDGTAKFCQRYSAFNRKDN